MKAEDLRIGNWVESKWDGSKILKVGKVHNSNVNNVPINLIHPIPLTEEILLKSGFENKELINNNYQKGEFYYHLDTCHFYTSDDLNAYCVKVEYVHQLQNLYFALTGEELEIEFIN